MEKMSPVLIGMRRTARVRAGNREIPPSGNQVYLMNAIKRRRLQPTALVHEAYLKLLADKVADPKMCKNRNQFFAIAARAIRQVLISHARAFGAAKRGGGAQRVPLDPDGVIAPAGDVTLDTLALHEAIEDLARLDARHAQIAEMRLFGGLSVAEVAEVMGGSRRLIQLEWKAAKHWLTDRRK